MPFPRRPETHDECRSELLRLMGVEGFPGIYVLGCFAKYVTVYAQQVRALNLVDTLTKAGRLSQYSRVAVIGGGIAGLTAAAGAAVRGVEEVQVFERLTDTMRLQRASEKRYVYPYIYDWPEPQEVVVRAELPLMDWKADRASEVVAEIARKWEEIMALAGGRLRPPRYGCKGIEVGSDERGPFVLVPGEDPQKFDAVILAVGFGLDSNENTNGYWADDGNDAQEKEKRQSWFVSGYGDGSLTDLMRLCIRDFQHGRVIHAVDKATRNTIGQNLMAAEQIGEPDVLTRAYLEAGKGIASALEGKLPPREFGEIWLNCSEDKLFSPRSSILNRLICAYLYTQKRFLLFDGGELILPIEKENTRYLARFRDKPGVTKEVDEVIVRHGPDKALKTGFPAIWEACENVGKVIEEWQSARQHEDWTRKPLYTDDEFDPRTSKLPSLRVHFGDRVGCVLITGSYTPAGTNQSQRVGYALNRLRNKLGDEKYAGRSIETTPRWIRVVDALASSAAYERTVRALCEAEIAVFDITELEGAVMLFLGIRAAVRRGITITVQKEKRRDFPFNLSSLNPILIEQGDAEQYAVAMESGLSALNAQQNAYLDLPVFDAVRRLGDEFSPKDPEKEILMLRWFDKQYGESVDGVVINELRSRFKAASIVTSLDSRSPQLVEQRLYSNIRRTKVCVADWTGWRPNVFFETGVRLAVNKIDPLFILCDKRPPGWKNTDKSNWQKVVDPSARALEDFFSPTKFSIEKEPGVLSERIKNFNVNSPARGTGAKLSPGRTYQVVSETLNRRDEPGGRPVHDLLMSEASAMTGSGVPEKGGSRVLYAEVLAGQVGRAAIEHVLAAWYYLAGRYKLIERLKDGRLNEINPEHVQALRDVGWDLQARLSYSGGVEFEAFLKELAKILDLLDVE